MSRESALRRNEFMRLVYEAAETTQVTKTEMIAALAHEVASIAQELAWTERILAIGEQPEQP